MVERLEQPGASVDDVAAAFGTINEFPPVWPPPDAPPTAVPRARVETVLRRQPSTRRYVLERMPACAAAAPGDGNGTTNGAAPEYEIAPFVADLFSR